MSLPLQGFTILEIGTALAGPFCGRILADLGARVIKIEGPSGDPSRKWGAPDYKDSSAFFHAVNKEKSSRIVDFAEPDQITELKSFIATDADAIVQNLRPGVADKAGLGPEDCRALNPRLVYCNVSAFGRTGDLSSAPGSQMRYLASLDPSSVSTPLPNGRLISHGLAADLMEGKKQSIQ